MVEAAWSLALVTVFVTAGWLASIAVLPEPLAPLARFRSSLALSIPATVVFVAPALLLGVFAPAAILTCLLIAAVAILGWRREAIRTTRAELGAALSSIRRPKAILAGSLALVMAFVIVVWPQLAALRPDGLPHGTSAWYYWRVVVEVVEAGRLPTGLSEWASIRPFPLEYLASTLHAAAAAILAGTADPRLAEAYRLTLLVVAILAAQALWSVWLPGWASWAAAMLTLVPTGKFDAFRPETAGFLLVLWSAWLLDESIRRGSVRWAALAGVVFGAAFLSHLEAWLIGLPLWAGIGLSYLLPLGRPGRLALRDAARVVVPSIAGFVCFIALLAAMTGSGDRLAGLVAGNDLGRSSADGASDPTLAFIAALSGRDAAAARPDDLWVEVGGVERLRQPLRNLDLGSPMGWLIVGGSAAVLALTWTRLPVPGRRAVVAWIVLAVGVLLIGIAVWEAYSTYIPRRAGPVRLMPYVYLALVGLVALAGWQVIGLIGGLARRRWPVPPARRRLVAHGSAVAGSLALVMLFAPYRPIAAEDRGVSTAALGAYRWIERETPEDAVILANGYTAGVIAVLAGRPGWLDGRAPYLEPREWLDEATSRLVAAGSFFRDPSARSPGIPAAIDYVLASEARELGTQGFLRAAIPDLQARDDLETVYSSSDGSIVILRVLRAADR